jgi:hypothetical protein
MSWLTQTVDQTDKNNEFRQMWDVCFAKEGSIRQLPDTCQPAFAFSVLFHSNGSEDAEHSPEATYAPQLTQRTRAAIRWKLRDLAPPDYAPLRRTWIPSFCILDCNVDRLIPRRAAAPFGPATIQFASSSAATIRSRSASSSAVRL